MELIANLALGFGVALSPSNLLYCFIGALVGTLVGVLPGLGPLAATAMLLPITFTLTPVGAIIMLAGIYYGAQYGGSISAILVNIPGESSAVVTCIDGHQMARQGRAGPALAISAIGSFIAGTIVTLLIAAVAQPLTEVALKFGPPEYFSLMVFGLAGATILASGSVLNAVAMIFVGLLLGQVGTDPNTGTARLTFGVANLYDGFDFIPVAMGLFGLSEILYNIEKSANRDVLLAKLHGLWPSREDLRTSLAPILRGTALGALLGILPGGGAILSSFTSYGVEKKLSATPERFGKGAIEGVAGPESANNAGAQASFIPMLALGIPANAVMALMIGAFTMHGIQPGPQIMNTQPNLFWGLIASMWIGNLMLLVINLPLIGIWIRLLRIPYHLLFPAILTFSCIGVYSSEMSAFHIVVMIVFGLIGYFLKKVDAEPAPLLLGFILGPMMEENLRRSLTFSRGDPMIFVERPISAALLAMAVLLVIAMIFPTLRTFRRDAFKEE